MTKAKEMKNAFHEAERKSSENGNEYDVYTFEMLVALRDMAKANVYPDGSFGDLDCDVWELFKGMTW